MDFNYYYPQIRNNNCSNYFYNSNPINNYKAFDSFDSRNNYYYDYSCNRNINNNYFIDNVNTSNITNINSKNNAMINNCLSNNNQQLKTNSNSIEDNDILMTEISDNSYDINKIKEPCGIINYGNNCYLNSGLQILATCEKFVKELEKYKGLKSGLISLLNEALDKILKEKIYDPRNFEIYFCKLNNEYLGAQKCSQTFIRRLLRNINNELIKLGDKHFIFDYDLYKPDKTKTIEIQKFSQFIESNKNFPECMAFRLFSGISKSNSYGKCQKCNKTIFDYSFSYFIDQNMYLDNIPESCNFSKVLFENLGNINDLTMNCPGCGKEIEIKEKTKIIKLPEILIFTLERYKDSINYAWINPDDTIDMKIYLDDSVTLTNTKYELFAINIRFGKTNDFGHEICQVKRDGIWYEINDIKAYKKTKDYNNNSYGLFYKRL
jgi:ubiquitin C-terminal hydrolase